MMYLTMAEQGVMARFLTANRVRAILMFFTAQTILSAVGLGALLAIDGRQVWLSPAVRTIAFQAFLLHAGLAAALLWEAWNYRRYSRGDGL